MSSPQTKAVDRTVSKTKSRRAPKHDESYGMKSWFMKHREFVKKRELEQRRRDRDFAADSDLAAGSSTDPPREPGKWTKKWLRERVELSLQMAMLEMDISETDMAHHKSILYTHLELWN